MVDNLCACSSNGYNSTYIANVFTSTTKVMYGGTRKNAKFKQNRQLRYFTIHRNINTCTVHNYCPWTPHIKRAAHTTCGGVYYVGTYYMS